MSTGHLWYVKQGTVGKGPYPISLLERHVVLGRLRADDMVSNDGDRWQRVADTPALADCLEENRRGAERMRMDERQSDRRGAAPLAASDEPNLRAGGDRREVETPEVIKRRARAQRVWQSIRPQKADNRATLIGVMAALVVIAVLAVILREPGGGPDASCDSPPRQAVRWDFCQKSHADLQQADLRRASARNSRLDGSNLAGAKLAGADLAYADLGTAVLTFADLAGARLVGANLHAADLSYANFRAADLRFADLTDANLYGADFRGARLGSVIWPDGRVCARYSTGVCMAPVTTNRGRD